MSSHQKLKEKPANRSMTGEYYTIWVLIGICFAFSGAILVYPSLRPYNYRLDPNYSGFEVFVNKTNISPVNPDLIVILSIEPNELYFQYFFNCEEVGTYNFLFVFPFNLTEKMSTTENVSFKSTPYGSAVWLQYVINETGSYNIFGKFVIEETFKSGSGGSYMFVLPFGFGFRLETVGNLRNELNVTSDDAYNQVEVSFVTPFPKYRIVQTFPQMHYGPSPMPGREREIAGARWMFEEELQESINIYVESPEEISNNQNSLFLGGILLGFGINIGARVAYDYVKERALAKYKRSTEVVRENSEEISDKGTFERNEPNHDSERRTDKLDSFFFWVCSLSALGFTVFVGYLQVPIAPYLPIFILIACSIAFGYVDGAILSDSFTKRIRGWIYLLMGLAIYVPFAVTEFCKSEIRTFFPNIPNVVMYFQLFFGAILPICYILLLKRLTLRIYRNFKVTLGDVTKAILQSSFLTSLYLACILYISALVLKYPESATYIKMLYVLFIMLFLAPMITEEIKTRHLLRLEKYQQFIKHESLVTHKRLPRLAFGLISIGIVALIVLLEYAGHLPMTPINFYFSTALFILAFFFTIIGLAILMIVRPRKDKFTLKDKTTSELSPDVLKQLDKNIDKLNNY